MGPSENEFTITLLSNASFDLHPKNNVYSFTNVLAQKLIFPEEENWRVCLHSISMATTSEDPNFEITNKSIQKNINKYKLSLAKAETTARRTTSIVDQLKAQRIANTATTILKDRVDVFNEANSIFVQCKQIIPKFGEERNITSFILPPEEARSGEFYTYQPNTEEYFNLATNEITEFDISINNSKGQKIYKTAAQPTIIVLKFKKMSLFNNSYTINVSNGDESPADFYAQFKKLQSRDDNQKPWEIAVSRLSFIPSFKKYPPGDFSISVVEVGDDYLSKFTPQTWDDYLKDKVTGEMDFQYNENHTPKALIKFFSEQISFACSKINLTGKMQEKNERLQITIRPSRKRKASSSSTEDATANENTTEKTPTKTNSSEIVLLILPEELIYVLGFDGDGIQYKNGYGAIPTSLKKTIKSKRKLNTNFLIPQNLLLYMDCIAPSLVGNIYGRYLTHVPVPIEETNPIKIPYVSYEPKNLEFHQLIQSDVSNVHIQLLKTDGKRPEFALSNIKIYITFLLREKQI